MSRATASTCCRSAEPSSPCGVPTAMKTIAEARTGRRSGRSKTGGVPRRGCAAPAPRAPARRSASARPRASRSSRRPCRRRRRCCRSRRDRPRRRAPHSRFPRRRCSSLDAPGPATARRGETRAGYHNKILILNDLHNPARGGAAPAIRPRRPLWYCPCVRVLIDYRAALRERSGVGEYTHQLVAALLAAYPPRRRPPPLALTLFSSSWKDRLALDPALAGAAAVDRRVPVRVLNFAWHRLGWPPVESLTGGRFDVTHSLHPLLLPSRAAAQVVTIHDLHFLEHPEQSARRNPARLPGARPTPHAARADHVVVPSRVHRVARSTGCSACRQSASACARPARPTGRRAAASRPTGTCCSSARSSRARTSARCSTRYERLIAQRRARAAAGRWRDARPTRPARGSNASRGRRSTGSRATSATSIRTGGASSTRARACSCSRRTKKASASRCSRR